LSIGELLWDVIDDQDYLGGAPFNVSVSLARLGNDVALVSAVGDDRRGREALDAIRNLGLSADFIEEVPGAHTGIALVTTDSSGNASFLIDRPAAFDLVDVDSSMLARLSEFHPHWVYFGTLAHTRPRSEAMLHRTTATLRDSRRFYDVNLREGHWNLELVQRLARLASAIKLNRNEAEILFSCHASREAFSLESFCRHWSDEFGIELICITLGSRGCAIWSDGTLRQIGGYAVQVVDTVGAGDAFSAGFLHGLQQGWTVERAATLANALGATVASRPGANPPWDIEECCRLVENSAPRGISR
jgi:fructokinase